MSIKTMTISSAPASMIARSRGSRQSPCLGVLEFRPPEQTVRMACCKRAFQRFVNLIRLGCPQLDGPCDLGNPSLAPLFFGGRADSQDRMDQNTRLLDPG